MLEDRIGPDAAERYRKFKIMLRVAMPSTVVHLHTINLDIPSEALLTCRRILSVEEKSRADQFTRTRLGNRWLVARAGLRDVLANYCAVSSNELDFGKEKFGKPVLVGRHTDVDLHFNLSHSNSLAVVAVTRVAPVGVDLEYKRALPDWESVARRFFSPSENQQLSCVAGLERQDAFYCCWTRKEAVIKATGEGLSARLDSFDVSLAPDAPVKVLADRGIDRESGDWSLLHFDIGDGYVGAVALRTSGTIKLLQQDHWTMQYV